MPELPDITVYIDALERGVVGRVLQRLKIANPFVLRTAVPPIDSLVGRPVLALRWLGKRSAFGFESERWLVLHFMIARRLRWTAAGDKAKVRNVIAEFVFAEGTLALTEAGTKRRASLNVVEGERDLAAHEPGGVDVFAVTEEDFGAALTRENHTLKSALTERSEEDYAGSQESRNRTEPGINSEPFHGFRVSCFKCGVRALRGQRAGGRDT